MKILFLLIIMLLSSCSEPTNQPKNLITKNEMSALVAEFALADQMSFVAPMANIETQTRYILKEHKIKARDFRESYTYYTGTNELNKIFDEAQNIILAKDPKAKDFIKNKLKDTKLLPAAGR